MNGLKGFSRLLAGVVAVACATMLVATASAQDADIPTPSEPTAAVDSPPAGPSPPAAVAPVAVPAAVVTRRVRVQLFGPDARLQPIGNVEVRRERYRRSAGMDAATELVAAWHTTTDVRGDAFFPVDPPPGVAESDRFVATWQGLDWDSDEGGESPHGGSSITVFPITTATDAFSMALDATVELRDTNFIVRQQWKLTNTSLEAIDFTRDSGLRIPLLVHAVFGAPFDLGFLPLRPDNRTTSFSFSPERGRLAVERGALVFRGVVPPGRAVDVRAGFAVPYNQDDSHTLALRSDFPMQARVSVVIPDQSGLTATLNTPHRTLQQATADGRQLMLAPVEDFAAREMLAVHIRNTPDRLAIVRQVGLGLAGGIFFVITAIFFATRRSGRRDG